VLALALGGASTAQAFDGDRSGFLLGFGIGAADTSYELSGPDAATFDPGDGDGVSVDLTIGGGVGEQLAFHLASHGAAHGSVEDDTSSVSLFGFGATYWLRPSGPSVYLSSTIGEAEVNRDVGSADGAASTLVPATGFGVRVAAGYEFSNRLRLEGSVTSLTVDGGFLPEEVEMDAVNSQLSLGYLWY